MISKMNTRLVFSSYFNEFFYRIACFSCKFSPIGKHSNFNLFPQPTMLKNIKKKKKKHNRKTLRQMPTLHSIFAVPLQELSSRIGLMVVSAPRSETLAFCFTALTISAGVFFVCFFLTFELKPVFASSHVFTRFVLSRHLLGNRHVDRCLHSSSLQPWEWIYLSHSDY